jgi:hypothetical protein
VAKELVKAFYNFSITRRQFIRVMLSSPVEVITADHLYPESQSVR